MFIIQQLLQSKDLNSTLLAYSPNLTLIQLRRTVLQSIIQTFGAIQKCTNGEIIGNKINHKLIGKLLKELLPVLHKDPLISSSPNLLNHFSFYELYRQVRNMAHATSKHVNSIVQDIAGKREMELKYHSGYLLRLARERGVQMHTWRTFHELVKAMACLEHNRHNEFVPVLKNGDVVQLPEWTYGISDKYWKIERVTEMGNDVRQDKTVPESEQNSVEEATVDTSEDQPTKPKPSEHNRPSLAKQLRLTTSVYSNLAQHNRPLIPIPDLRIRSKKGQSVNVQSEINHPHIMAIHASDQEK